MSVINLNQPNIKNVTCTKNNCPNLGLTDFHRICTVAQTQCNYPVPILNPHMYSAVIGIAQEGVVVIGLIKHHSHKNKEVYYTYSNDNGVFPIDKIQYCSVTPNGNQQVAIIALSNHRKCTLKGSFTSDGIKFLQGLGTKNVYNNGNIISGNLIDLYDDPTYVGVHEHISWIQQEIGVSPDLRNTTVMSIKSKYLPQLSMSIFSKCNLFPKRFLVNYSKQGIVFMQLRRYDGLYFLTGMIDSISVNDIQHVGFYSITNEVQRLIIDAKSTVIIMTFPRFNLKDFKQINNASQCFNYIANIVNIENIGKLQYRSFIHKCVKEIKSKARDNGYNIKKLSRKAEKSKKQQKKHKGLMKWL